MAKQQHRKPAKRPAKRPKIDDDLILLATALGERALDKSAEGWFSVPWRLGWNAAQLAIDAYFELVYTRRERAHARPPSPLSELAADVSVWIRERRADARAYWRAGDARDELGRGDPLIRAALRCIQVMIAKSDGGGDVYNALLLPAFEAYVPEQIEALIEAARCRDAIGEQMLTAGHERRRKAFQIAWRRGLYQAAYAV